MSTVITRMLIAVVFATAAWLSWSESKLAARVADARQDIATFNHDNLDALTPERALSDYLPGDRRRLAHGGSPIWRVMDTGPAVRAGLERNSDARRRPVR